MYIPRSSSDEPKIIIFSGAGLDAPAGLSTYRDKEGLWNNYKISEVCNENTWKDNFIKVHNFYNDLRKKLSETEPNYAYSVLKEIYDEYPDNVINVTMNISDFYERSNIPVLHVHGELTKMECEACGNRWDIGYNEWNIEKDTCPECNSKKGVRPSIVFFGGQAPMYSFMWRAFEYTMDPNSIVVIVGTQGNVVSVEENLISTPCKKILCNMESSPDINEMKMGFDKVYYESIDTAIDKIKNNIKEWRKR